MSVTPDFRKSWLWRHAFVNSRADATPEDQEFFRGHFLAMREKAAQLVSRIAADMPEMTVHDITHLDALWDTASSVAEGALNINPAEAFVFGGAVLLHDSAMSVAAYPNGLAELKQSVAWKDALARAALLAEDSEKFDVSKPPEAITKQILSHVLRRLHAEHAEELAELSWADAQGQKAYLIEDSELRNFYGSTIGQIAHSHWWSIHKVEAELESNLGALGTRTKNVVDRLKLACLLRIADALHLDSRRAPRFLRILLNPAGESAKHWAFQERLASPHVELDAVAFTAGQPFPRAEAEAWWLAYDTLTAVDRELRDVDLLLQSSGRSLLKARRVKGAGSPEMLARTVKTKGWRPVDARLQVSDVPRIVESLGGSKLYGNDPTVALRELIQNAADAIQARRKFQKRGPEWGEIKVGVVKREDAEWLIVEDNGIGMSEAILTGPLLDFGTSFWRSPQAMEEFPGLMASGMNAIGKFGIGFFSIFMLGTVVRVYSRRCDRGQDTGRMLEFRDGTSARPILSPASDGVPIDGGTRVEVKLAIPTSAEGGLLSVNAWLKKSMSLARLTAAVAPNINVAISTMADEKDEQIIKPGDWLEISDAALLGRLNPLSDLSEADTKWVEKVLMRQIVDADGKVYGRAFVRPSRSAYSATGGWVTISGLRAARLYNVQGVLMGEALTAARDAAQPTVPKDVLAKWATEQASLICANIKDEEYQAMAAEVILECGGEIGALKVVKLGDEWLDLDSYISKVASGESVLISFDGEFSYDEDSDDVHPKEFREDFSQSADVAIVLKHDGMILKAGNRHWPESIADLAQKFDSRVATLIRLRLTNTWAVPIIEQDIQHEVGTVGSTEIVRSICMIARQPAEADKKPTDFSDIDF